MIEKNYLLQLWDDKWKEFLESQRLAILLNTNDEVADMLMDSAFYDKKFGDLLFNSSSGNFALSFSRRDIILASLSTTLDLDSRERLVDILNQFPFQALDYTLDNMRFKELEIAIKYTNWDISHIKIKSHMCRGDNFGIEVIEKNINQSVVVYSKESREKVIDEEFSLERHLEYWKQHLMNDDCDDFFDMNYSFVESPVDIDAISFITGLRKKAVYSKLNIQKGDKISIDEAYYFLRRFGFQNRFKEYMLNLHGGYKGVLFKSKNYNESTYEDYFVYERTAV